MGQWGVETYSGDSVYDCLDEFGANIHNMSQKDATEVLDEVWKKPDEPYYNFDKLGVVLWLLTHGLTVPIDKLKQALEYANTELHPAQLKHWSRNGEREEMLNIEMNDINFALENKGKGRIRTSKGLLEKMGE
jgi:hypothetical protein